MYKKKLVSFSILLVILFLSVQNLSCRSISKVVILGKWESANEDVIEFYNSGELIQTTILDLNVSGTYRIIDNENIEIEYRGIGNLLGPQILKYKLDFDELTIIYPIVGATHYIRNVN